MSSLIKKSLRSVAAALKDYLRDDEAVVGTTPSPQAAPEPVATVTPIRPDPLTCIGEVWCGSGNDNMLLIAGLARSTRARRYLEIGAYRGFTTGFVRWGCPGVEVHAIDNWQRANTSSQQLINGVARISGTSDNIFVHEGDSQEQLKKLVDQGMTFDLIYVDGCHTYEAAKADFEMALKLLGPTGTIVVDDTVTWWGPRELSEEIQQRVPAGFHLLELTTSNGLLVLRKQPKAKPEVVLTRQNCPDGVWKDEAPPQLKSA